MSRLRTYDLLVVGGGTAGLVSSVIAAGTGARVALIERERTGGDCLWTGCVPSKTLIASARLAHKIRNAGELGLRAADPGVDFAAVMERVQAAIAEIEPHDSPGRLRSEGVEVIEGDAFFRDRRTVEAAGRSLRFRSAIIASGSEPISPPIDGLAGFDAEDVSSTETIWRLRQLPERLVVLGGGPVGCELGQAFARLGSRVTIVELGERLLPKEEPQAAALIAERLRAEGVELVLGAAAEAVRPSAPGGDDGGARSLVVRGGGAGAGAEAGADAGERAIAFDQLLIATGRRPRSAGLGLGAIGVETDGGGAILVDERLRTSVPRIFAAGDVTGRLAFTHVAAHHARLAAINALFGARGKVSPVIPRVTFTDPELAAVGLSLAEARARWGQRAVAARSDYAELDRAITEGEARGFALLIGDPKGRLVGATIAAPGAGEAIAELSAWITQGESIEAVSHAVHAYPTLAEGPARAADEYLRVRYAKPTYRLLAKAALVARRLLVRG